MNWTIYSIGDSAFLEQILNSVAMVVGTGDFSSMVRIGLLLGVLLVGFQAITRGGGIQFQKVLIAWIMFTGMFGTSARVLIEDVYSGTVRVVDNVPFGIAAAGSVLSRIGYSLTHTFETAFGHPEMTDRGFAAPLNELGLLRGAFADPTSWSGVNDATNNGANLRQSWYNYVKECTMRGVQLGHVVGLSEDSIWANPDPVEALRFDSGLYSTEIYLGGAAMTLPCDQAHDGLRLYTNGPFAQAAWDMLSQRRSGDVAATNVFAQTAVEDALMALGRANVSAQNYMLANVLMPIYEAGMEGRALTDQQFGAAIMTRQAIEQRNAEWAGEFTLFASFVRPMMTFMEGFAYALAPIMAFLITLGPTGISVAGKYFLTLIWIQLWMPVLAIINLYLMMTVNREMEAFAPTMDSVADVSSFAGLSFLFSNLQSWLSTGGMLASAVPALTLTIVYGGSAVTATFLAGRLSKGDYLDEQQVKPRVSQNSPAMGVSSQFSVTPTEGGMMTGAGAMMPVLSNAAGLSTAVSSAEQYANASRQEFRGAVGQTLGEVHGMNSARSVGQDWLEGLKHSEAKSDNMLYNTVKRLGQESGLSAEARNDFELKLAGSLTGSTGLEFFGNGAKASAEGAVKGGWNEQMQQALRHAVNTEAGQQAATDFRANYDRQLAQDVKAGESTAVTEGLSREQRQTLEHAAGRTVSADDTFSRMEQMQQQRQSDWRVNMGQLTNLLAAPENAQARGELGNIIRDNPHLQGSVERLEGFFGRHMDANRARVAAQATAIEQHMMSGAEGSLETGSRYGAVLGSVLGWQTPEVNAGRNQGLVGPGEAARNAADEAAVQAARVEAPQQVDDRIAAANTRVTAAIDGHAAQGTGQAVTSALEGMPREGLGADGRAFQSEWAQHQGRLNEDPRKFLRASEALLGAVYGLGEHGMEAINRGIDKLGIERGDGGKLDLGSLTPAQTTQLADTVAADNPQLAAEAWQPLAREHTPEASRYGLHDNPVLQRLANEPVPGSGGPSPAGAGVVAGGNGSAELGQPASQGGPTVAGSGQTFDNPVLQRLANEPVPGGGGPSPAGAGVVAGGGGQPAQGPAVTHIPPSPAGTLSAGGAETAPQAAHRAPGIGLGHGPAGAVESMPATSPGPQEQPAQAGGYVAPGMVATQPFAQPLQGGGPHEAEPVAPVESGPAAAPQPQQQPAWVANAGQPAPRREEGQDPDALIAENTKPSGSTPPRPGNFTG